jgi:Co/Zn/Cd efflux system component
LLKHRADNGFKDGDANVRSIWLRSRNDAIGNVVVMAAAFGVWVTSTLGQTWQSPR